MEAIAQWQLLFLILGAVTSAYGILLFLTLPDSPAKAIFLKSHERAIAVQRTLKNKTGVMDQGNFKWNQVWMAVKDPQMWFLVLYTLCVNFCNGGLTSFSAIIITGFGFPHLEALLIQMPIGGAQLVFLILSSGVASLVPKTRILMMIFNTAVSMVGMLLIWKLGDDNRAGKMTGLCLGGVFAANIPLSLSLISSNVAGFTKKKYSQCCHVCSILHWKHCWTSVLHSLRGTIISRKSPFVRAGATGQLLTFDRRVSKLPCPAWPLVYSS